MATLRSNNPKLSIEDINRFEKKAKITIPEDYKKFLLLNNGADISPNEFKVPKRNGGNCLSTFFGIVDGINGFEYILKTFKKRYPNDFLPIAREMCGNLILIGTGETNLGHIFFWDHDREQDSGVKADMSNIREICPRLEDFINSMYESAPVSSGPLTDIFDGFDR